LVHQVHFKDLESESKPDTSMVKKDKKSLLEKTRNVVVLSLGDKMLRHVSKEKTTIRLWTKLESLHDEVVG